MRRARDGRAGHTLPELTISVLLLVVLTSSIYRTIRTVQGTHDITSAVATLESRGHRAVDRILGLLRAADGGTVWPTPTAPASASEVHFQRLAEQPDGSLELSGLERIRLDPQSGEVSWTRDLGLATESTVALGGGVPPLLDGEVMNFDDDNGNGLEDEPGLCFSFEDGLLVVRLTLQGAGPAGDTLVRTFEGRVAHRNGS